MCVFISSEDRIAPSNAWPCPPPPLLILDFLFFGIRKHYVVQPGFELVLLPPLPSGSTSLDHHVHLYMCIWNFTRHCKLTFMGFNSLISSPIFCVHISLSVWFLVKKKKSQSVFQFLPERDWAYFRMFKSHLSQEWWYMSLIPAFRRQRQMDLSRECQVSQD